MTREEAIQTIQEMCKRYIFMLDEDEAIDMAIEALSERNIARDIATILENEQDMRVMLQNAERPKGEWIIRENGNKECSLCGHERQDGWDYFCGYCGAKMKGESHDNQNQHEDAEGLHRMSDASGY